MASRAEDLIERMEDGDGDALAAFIDGHRSQLLAYIDRQTGIALKRKVDAQDILQEVSIEALRILPEQDFSRRDAFGWLCHLAERRIIDAYRRVFGARKRDAAREVPLGTPGAPTAEAGLVDLLVVTMTTPSQAFARGENADRLRVALESLPDLPREALRLRYAESLPTKEIAALLGKTDGAIRVLLTRSLRRLQEILDESTSV